MNNLSSTFCIMPFTHIVTKTNGDFKLCCRSKPLYNIKEKSLLEVWNSDKYRKVRKQLLNNERPIECKVCWDLEENNVGSMREKENESKKQYIPIYLKGLKEDFSMPEDSIKSIELKLNNLCNLKCRMCHPLDSILWMKDWSVISHLQKENEWTYNNVIENNLEKNPYICEWEKHNSFFDDIEKISNTLETIWFAGGEPLIDPLHYKILDSLGTKSKNIKLQYATNLTSLTFGNKHIIDYWKNFNQVLIGVSFDGLHDTFEYIRTNANFKEVFTNIQILKDTISYGIITATLTCNTTFQALNIFELPEIFDFLLQYKVRVHTHRVTQPKFLSSQVLPKQIKSIITTKIQKYIEDIKLRDLYSFEKKNVIKHARDNLKFMNGKDLNYLWSNFLEYNNILDKRLKGKVLKEIRPELGDYI